MIGIDRAWAGVTKGGGRGGLRVLPAGHDAVEGVLAKTDRANGTVCLLKVMLCSQLKVVPWASILRKRESCRNIPQK